MVTLVALAALPHPLLQLSGPACGPGAVARRQHAGAARSVGLDRGRGLGGLASGRDYLQQQQLHDRELTCLHWRSFLELYLKLHLQPSTRFPSFSLATAFSEPHRAAMFSELAHSPQQYLVGDLCDAGLTRTEAAAGGPDGCQALPPAFSPSLKSLYPWSEPLVFRAGRYAVLHVAGSTGGGGTHVVQA